jgi:hypothetical protein
MIRKHSQNWFDHALRPANWQPQRQVVALAALGFFIALILGALYLSQVASEATTGRRLGQLLAERDELERVNEQLRAEIASLRRVARLQERAEQLGFTLADRADILYLPVYGYNPVRPDTVAPLTTDAEPLPVYDETFTGWLQEQWDQLRLSIDSLINGE